MVSSISRNKGLKELGIFQPFSRDNCSIFQVGQVPLPIVAKRPLGSRWQPTSFPRKRLPGLTGGSRGRGPLSCRINNLSNRVVPSCVACLSSPMGDGSPNGGPKPSRAPVASSGDLIQWRGRLWFDLDVTGFDLGEIGSLIAGLEIEEPEDDVLPSDAPRLVRRGVIWQLDRHRLACPAS